MTTRFSFQSRAALTCVLALSFVAPASAQTAKPAPTKPSARQAGHATGPVVPVETAALRIACEGDNAKAEVSINGTFRGECPLDVSVPAGTVTVRVTKPVNKVFESFDEEQLRLGPDTAKRVDVALKFQQFRADAVARMDAEVEALLGRKEAQQRSELPDLERAAEGGAASAMRRLGMIHKFGLAGPVDYRKAGDWYARGAQAKDPESMYELGKLNEQGLSMPVNEAKAVELLRAAAEAGNPKAMFDVAGWLEDGEKGFKPNLQAAADYLEKAAQAGVPLASLSWGAVERKLNRMEMRERLRKDDQMRNAGIAIDRKLAEGLEDFDAIRSSSTDYYGPGLTEADHEVGLRYSRIYFRYMKKAVATGDARPLIWLGRAYRYGIDTPKDLAMARRLFRQAISLGDPWGAAEVAALDK